MSKLKLVGLGGIALAGLLYLLLTDPIGKGAGCTIRRDTVIVRDTVALPPATVDVDMVAFVRDSSLQVLRAARAAYLSDVDNAYDRINYLESEIDWRDSLLDNLWQQREGRQRFETEWKGIEVKGELHLISHPPDGDIRATVTLDTVVVPHQIITVEKSVVIKQNDPTVLIIVGTTAAVLGFAFAHALK